MRECQKLQGGLCILYRTYTGGRSPPHNSNTKYTSPPRVFEILAPRVAILAPDKPRIIRPCELAFLFVYVFDFRSCSVNPPDQEGAHDSDVAPYLLSICEPLEQYASHSLLDLAWSTRGATGREILAAEKFRCAKTAAAAHSASSKRRRA